MKAEAVQKKIFISRIAFSLLVALLLFVAIVYLVNIFRWEDYPDLGLGFRTATGIKIVGTVTEPGRQAGLQVGDVIISVNGKSYNTFGELRSILNRQLGDKNIYLVERNGEQIPITIVNGRIGFSGAFKKSGLLLVLGLCYMMIGSLVFLMKPHQRTSWIFLLFSTIIGLYMTFLYKITVMTPYWLEAFHLFIYTLSPAVFLHLTLSFPVERDILKKHSNVQWIPYIISLVLFLSICTKTYQITDAPKPLLIIAVIYMAVAILLFLGSLLQLWIKSKSDLTKSRSKLILLGAGISTLVPLIDFISSAFFKVYILPNFNFYLPFFIFFPLAIGYAIVKHDLFDIDAIIKRTYGYVLTTGAIAGIYGLFVLISNVAFGGLGFAKSPLFPLIFILAVVFLFNPIRNRVQRFIDRVFYRLEYDYQEVVGKIGETLRSLLKLEDIGQSVMQFALQPMFVDAGAVMILNRQKDAYDCLIHEGVPEEKKNRQDPAETAPQDAEQAPAEVECLTLPPQDPFVEKLAQRKRATTVYDLQEDPFFKADRSRCLKTFDQLGATLVVPLIYEDQLIGMISLGRKKSGKFYRREDINLLNTLANQAAVAIENAFMVEEVIEKERMDEELSIARNLQVSMLPAECPRIEDFEIAAFSESAREVGGDFYDFIEISDNRLGIVIGDVTGKSVSGALVMAASRSIFRMLGDDRLSVSESMMRANRRTKKDIKSGMFVALLYAVINAGDKRLDLCSAGQTQPIFRSATTGETSLVQTRGDTFPLGILEEAEYKETQLQLQSGDTVILYTDGVVEAMNENNELFGFDRLLETIKGSKGQVADTLLDEIKTKVSEFTGSAPQHDDITIIVVQAV